MRDEMTGLRERLFQADPQSVFNEVKDLWETHALSAETPEEKAFLASMLAQSPETQDRAKQLITEAFSGNLDDLETSAFASDVGISVLLMGQVDTAIEVLKKAASLPEPDALVFSRLGSAFLLRGYIEEAETNYREAIAREPHRAEWLYNLGAALVRQNRLEEALEAYDEVLRLNEDFKAASNARLQLLGSMGRADELVEALEAQFDPEDLDSRIKLANAYQQNRQPAKAINTINDALIKFDEVEDEQRAEQFRLRQVLVRLLSEPPRPVLKAAALYQASQLADNKAPYLAEYASELADLGRDEKADEAMAEALELDADNIQVQLAYAGFLTKRGEYRQAIDNLLPFTETYSGHAGLFSELGRLYMWIGELEDATHWFDRAAAINPQALSQMVEVRDIPEDDRTVRVMEQMADNRLMPPMARASMNYAVARIKDKHKRYDEQFERLIEANDQVEQTITYRPKQFARRVNAQKRFVNKKFFERQEPIRRSERTPVFVCGMPRSGTTLTEQILCSHPSVFGAGELGYINAIASKLPRVLEAKHRYPACLWKMDAYHRERAAVHYWNNVAEHDEAHPYVVDKMPHNFMHLGLIASIFPNVRIIHANRDPRDTAISCFQQNFAAKHGGMGFSFSLPKIAHQIVDYLKMMEHWRRVLPVPIFESHYEVLVADQEGATRELLNFVGVEWDDKVRDFHKTERAVRTASVTQVRRPIYKTSAQKWRRYEDYLDPLEEIFEMRRHELEEPSVLDKAPGSDAAGEG